MSKTNPNQELEERAELAKAAVLTVLVFRVRTIKSVPTRYVGFGTAFVIKSDNTGSIVLTANHVVEDMLPGDTLFVRSMIPDGVRQQTANVLYQHQWSDVAVLRVAGLRNVVPLNFEPAFRNGDGVIGVGYANPIDLFSDVRIACKRIPDLSPGNIVEEDETVFQGGIDITNLHLEMVCMKGMSGMPILKTTGVVGMLIAGSGAYSTTVSCHTLFQVLKRYYIFRLHQTVPRITKNQIDAHVNPMTMEQVIDALS